MKKTTRAACLGLAFLTLAGTAGAMGKITAHANSALAYWRGTTATGAIVTDEQCPIEVEQRIEKILCWRRKTGVHGTARQRRLLLGSLLGGSYYWFFI